MPMELLHRLALERLPVSVTDGQDVDGVRLLALAGHIRAEVPRPVRTLEGYHQPPATVTAITPLGRQMLRRFPLPARRR
ncbi:hypothetical protein [Xenophilus sp. Marseille-Q4582]|uniref:hypothetical protein n=1 Tax=Xenophilus sp. Marseille-Q4582 TaxID=2866600 RepID=UPI001CE3F357|nr:hypothetical protein [Xenophilus sp. Marseille-Q4582]